jgi:two-component system, sensor histidine kinase and response regulator
MKAADLSGSRILIVDDQQPNVDLLEQILDIQGYRNVIGTTDPRQVASICQVSEPDLVLLDLHMPHLTGLEVIEQLRGLVSVNSYLPILVLTADITPEAKRHALEVGASDFLSKPFDVMEVLLRVRNLLETRHLHIQVQNHNRHLEETVRERTKELEATQKQLVQKNEELSSALAKASEVAELKGQFLANINHEIRTPINGILGMVNLLGESQLNAEQLECTDMLKTSANWLVKLMNDILDVSQLGAGKVRIETRSFDLRVLLEEVSAVYRARAHAKGLKFTTPAPPALPQLVRGDPARLRQVLDQLLCNAIKFTESGKVSLNAEIVHETSDAFAIKFAVEDTGIGITEEQRTRLFQVFVQGDGSSTRRYGGTGIGLTLSKQLVELLGGDIGVDSLSFGGTKAWFTAVLEKPQTDPSSLAVESNTVREFARFNE